MNRSDTHFTDHPNPKTLREFAVGLIEDEDVINSVEDHVSSCPECVQYISSCSPDAMESVIAQHKSGSEIDSDDKSNRYEIIEEIGRGGTGIVYRARQAGLDRQLAFKVLISGARAARAELARFRREAHALAQLDHPQIVRVYDFGEQQGAPFLAMELVDGPTLAKRLEQGPIDQGMAAIWVRDLARAMEYAHKKSMFHRDLKPQNVLLARSGGNPVPSTPSPGESTNKDSSKETFSSEDRGLIPKIVDFGLVQFECESWFHTKTGETLGTPAYIAPEMIGCREVGSGQAAIDVYGLGTILYECLTGRPPFVGSSQLEIFTAVSQQDPLSLRMLRPGVARDLAIICERCLAKNPAQRFATADELAEDLDRYLTGTPIKSRAVSATERTVRWCRRNPWKALAGSMLFLGMLAIPAAGVYHNAQLRHEKQIAQSRYESTRATLWEMLNLLNSDQTASIPQLAELSAEQTERALKLFEELSIADPTDRSRLELAKGEILAGTLAIVLGKNGKAESHLKHAVNICEELQFDSEIGDEALKQLAAALNKLASGVVRDGTDNSSAIEYMEKALEIHRKLAKRNPNDPDRRGGVAWSLMNLGSALQVQGKLDQAVELYEEVIPIWDSLANEVFKPDESRQASAGTRINLASIQLMSGKVDSAQENFRLALETLEQLFAQSPDEKSVVEDLTSGLLNYSNCLAGNEQMDEAVAACSRARELLLVALVQEPNRALLKQNLFLVTANRANLYAVQKKLVESAADWLESCSISPDPAMKTYCRQMRLCCLAKMNDVTSAEEELSLIDESSLNPDEKFLQALCLALIAAAQNRQVNDEPVERTRVSTLNAAAKAWELLKRMQADGELNDEQRREHLKTSEDWTELRRIRTAREWDDLVR